MDGQEKKIWSVWIDDEKKIITVKKSLTGKEVFFQNRKTGINVVLKLLSKGYKIG